MTWLVAIGLNNAAWASVLAILAWAASRYARRPALSRLLWVIVLLKLLAPPLVRPAVFPAWLPAPSGWLAVAPERKPVLMASISGTTADLARVEFSSAPGHEMEPAMAERPQGAASGLAAELSGPRQPAIAFIPPPHIPVADCLWWFGLVWICGSLFCAVRFGVRSWRFRVLLRRVAREDETLSRRVARLAEGAGLRTLPRVLFVDGVVSPMLWGAGRFACLIFPAELWRRIDEDSRDSLLLHEMAHYARGDWLVRSLELIALVAYWWNPVAWLARRQIEAAEEECCDSWVLAHQTGPRRSYAEALLATLDFLCEPMHAIPPAACGLGAAPLLRQRLNQILSGDLAVHPSRALKAAALAVAAVALPCSPGFFASAPRVAEARSTPAAALPPAIVESSGEAMRPPAAPPRAETALHSWFVAREPLPPLGPVLFASVVAPSGKYRLEARTGYRTTLIDVEAKKPLDLSAYRIRSACFSPDGNLLITAQDEESFARLWRCKTGEVSTLFKGSEAPLTSVAFAPDGERIAAGAADGSVLVWSVNEDEPIARLPRQDSAVSCLRWSPDADALAIALGDWSNRDSSSIMVWRPRLEVADGLWSLEQATGALEWLADDELLVSDWSGEARVFELSSGAQVDRLSLGKDSVSAAAFSPDCRLTPRWQAMRNEP